MKEVLCVGLGGFVGSIARYMLGGIVLQHSIGWRFPLSTFLVNLAGCFLFGAVAGVAERHAFLNAELRLLIFTGLLGGFTTFSAFGAESVNLIRRGDVAVAAAYIIASVLCGFAALWIALKLFGASAAHA